MSKDVNDVDLPQWAIDLLEKKAKERHPAGKKRGLITVIPNDIDPELWGAMNGFA